MPPDYELLRSVSRSFYLSIRALPGPLRKPVAVAYLLARASDTIADASAASADQRVQLLDEFSATIADQQRPVANLGRSLVAELNLTASPAMSEAERQLITSVDSVLDQLRSMSAEDRADVSDLLTIIVRGQRLDLTRWHGEIKALASAEQLRDYTYLVAGCVGEFWTKICARKLDRFSARPIAEMLDLGKRYGCGLQLINILRDAGDDLRAGRCYFPADELRAEGISAREVLNVPERFAPIYRRWIEEAKRGIGGGVEYSLAIKSARLRAATVLPAMIGTRTLRLLQERGTEALRDRIKIPRDEVRGMIASLFITLANRERLRGWFAQQRK